MTNKEIIKDALAEIKNEETFRVYNIMLDVLFREHVGRKLAFAIYLSSQLWHKHTEDITLDDISFMQSCVYDTLCPKQTQVE